MDKQTPPFQARASSLKNLLLKLRETLYTFSAGHRILFFYRASGIADFVSRYYHKKTARAHFQKPTRRMEESRVYFAANDTRVRQVASSLYDDESKDCFKKIIDFRCNCDLDAYPPYDTGAQYFYPDFIKYSDNEVLVDCGAFIGDSIEAFIRAIKQKGGRYKKIVALEPDAKNYRILKNKQKRIAGMTLLGVGAYSRDTRLRFNGGAFGTSSVAAGTPSSPASPDEDASIEVKAIDHMPECHDATFIKMDIEGSELDALRGAENTIRNNLPTLAVCVYHKDADMLEIAEWIHSLDLGYRLYVRQHGVFDDTETVLYAVRPEKAAAI